MMPLLSQRGGHTTHPLKHEKMESKPVLFFDNRPSGSYPAIELLTIPEVAEVLKISPTGVRRLQQKRAIPFTKVGGVVRFFKSDIVAYLIAQRVEPFGT